jgi:hypothetical protein
MECAWVVLSLIGAAPSAVTFRTRPRTAKYLTGFSGSQTVKATRGLRSMFLIFWNPATLLIRMCSPSVSTQVCVSWGEPSGIKVARKHGLG